MELNHLKYFHSVVKEGSFTKAAKAMRIQQPTISKMVRLLEEELGVTLVERYRSGVHLTHAGAEIFQRCEEIFSYVDEIQSVSGREMTECQGSLSFGITDSAGGSLGPRILQDFMVQHPKVRPSIFVGSSNLICNELLEGRVEFGMFFTVPSHDEFYVRDLVKVPFLLVIATAAQKNPRVRSSFIISRDIDYPKARPFPVLEMLRRNKIEPVVAASSNNLEAQKQLVLNGLGVALLPRFMVKKEIESGELTPLFAKKDFSYTLKLVTRKRRTLSKNSEAFLDYFTRTIPDLV